MLYQEPPQHQHQAHPQQQDQREKKHHSPRETDWAPTKPDLEVEIIYIHRNTDEIDEAAGMEEEVAQLRLRPIAELLEDVDPGGEGMEGGEVGAEDEVRSAEAGGGGEEEEGGEEGEGAGVAIHGPRPLPAAIQNPRPRRRPPREQWFVTQNYQPQDPEPEPVQPQIIHQEEEERHLTGSGRLTKPPNFYGVEKGREGDLGDPILNVSTSHAEREETHPSPPPASSCSPTPPGSVRTTPMSTPATSPDTSGIDVPPNISWLLPPMPCSLTAAERAQEPTQRHRHWSFTGAGVYPNHPRFLNWYGQWDPGLRTRRSSAEP